MITTLVSDFSYVLIFPKDQDYQGTLNGLYKTLSGEYNFFDHYKLNEELLELYMDYKKQGLSVNIFTAGSMQDDPQLKPILTPVFDNIYSAGVLNMSKSDPEAYLKVAELLGKKPEEIVFIDDQLVNVEAAREAGLNIVYYVSVEDTLQKLKQLIPRES